MVGLKHHLVLASEQKPVDRALQTLVSMGMLGVSGMSYVGGVLTAVRGMWGAAVAFVLVGALFHVAAPPEEKRTRPFAQSKAQSARPRTERLTS